MHQPDTAIECIEQVIHALDLGGHSRPAGELRQLLAELEVPATRSAAGQKLLSLMTPRGLDFHLPFLKLEEWLEILNGAHTRIAAELPKLHPRKESPGIPADRVGDLMRAHSLSEQQCRRALLVAGGNPWEAGRFLFELRSASAAPAAAWIPSRCYALKAVRGRSPQTPADRTCLGGLPALEPDSKLPRCGLCESLLTFFFQIEMPDDTPWKGSLFLVFACTSCGSKEALFPSEREVTLAPAPSRRPFRFLRIDSRTAVLRTDYPARIRFQRLKPVPAAPDARGNKIGGRPTWVGEAEYAPGAHEFLLCQLTANQSFETLPSPATAGLSGSGKARHLFGGNAIYLFGSTERQAVQLVLQKG